MTSTPHAGVLLADSRYESEENAYLQRRLVVFYGVVVALAGTLYVAGGVLWGLADGLGKTLLDPGRVVHLAAMVAAAGVLLLLRRRKLGASALVFFDALGLHMAIGASVAIYALDYRLGPHSISAVLALFTIARAVVVPCSARRTFLLSLPAPLGVLAVQLAHGTGYAQEGVEMTHDYFVGYVVWNQVILVLAVGIAALASEITFGLRHLVREATKLGQYRLEERIGKGAMGEVYRGQHAMLRRPTAIKVIYPDATDPELLQRFEREVRQTARLSHPNTVQIFDYGRTPEGAFYYAMEYLDGADLRRIVEESGPMPASRVIHVLKQACGALKEAHEAGLVHRDVKPGNIVLCHRGGEHDVVKLVDFGLVKDLGSASPEVTQVGQICGTPETIAPEVLLSGQVTPAADLYALGIVGYYLLTGRPIFDAQSTTEVIGHHLHTAPIPPRERLAAVPEDLEVVILRCLEKNPADRFADCGELRQALRRCLDAGLWSEKRAAAWWKARAKGRAA